MLLGYNSFHSTMTVSVVSMAGIAQSKAHSWDCTVVQDIPIITSRELVTQFVWTFHEYMWC